MSIDPSYQQIHNKALQMQYSFQDLMGTGNPTAALLHREAKHLVDDIEMEKNPKDLEHRIQIIQSQMKQVQHQGSDLISSDNANSIHQRYEQMRQEIRKFSNYS